MVIRRMLFVAVLCCVALVNFSCDKESETSEEEVLSIKKSEIDDEDDT